MEKIPLMEDDVALIEKLGMRPGSDNGMTPEALKKEFDKGPILLKKNLNRVITAVNNLLSASGGILSGGNMSGALNMNSNRLFGVKIPAAADDAANKQYVDDSLKAGKEYADSLSTWRTATLGTSWTGSGPYTQTVSVPGIPAEAKAVTCWPAWAADAATREKQREAWNAVSRIVPSAGAIAFTCDDDKPVTAVPMRIEVQL